MKRIVCVTGCLGFMGNYFVKTCLDMGWYVIGIDKIDVVSNLSALKEFKKHEKFKFIKEDISCLTDLYDCDFIVNFAASSHVDKSLHSSKQFIQDNVFGVYNLLELIRIRPKETRPVIIHLSTDETYGDIEHGSHLETDLLKPSNPYSASKASSDMLIIAWARTYDIKYNIIRPTNNYGIGQYPEKLIPKTCKFLHLGKKIPLHNHGNPKRIWLHAQDTANGIIKVIETGNRNEIYNISGNCEFKNVEIVQKIVKILFNTDAVEKYCDFSCTRPGQDVRYSLNDDKLRKLGWKNNYILDNELPSIVRYYQSKFIW